VKLGISLCLPTLILVVALPSQTVTAGSLQAETRAQPYVLSTGQTHEKGDTDPPPTVHGVELPFRFSEGYLIMVEGQIGTQTNLKFILDTGATISIVDSRIADEQKLPCHPAESLSFDRKLAWQATTVPEVEFGQIKAKNIQMLVGHLGKYSEFAKKADAIIGMDLLKLSNFSIDYDSKKIIFHSHQREYIPASGEPLSECLILELQVQGHPVRLIVDTGLPGLLLYEERLLKRVPTLRIAGSPTGVSIGGRLQAKQAVLPDVVFGARNGEVSVLLVKAPPPDTLPGIDGIVGLAPLKARRVYFDFVGKRLSWE
jgi:predicted aspartyl protease